MLKKIFIETSDFNSCVFFLFRSVFIDSGSVHYIIVIIIIIICEFTPKVHSLEEWFIKCQAATSSLRHSILFLVSQLFQGGLTSGCSEYHRVILNSSNVLLTFWEWSQGPQPLLESLLL